MQYSIFYICQQEKKGYDYKHVWLKMKKKIFSNMYFENEFNLVHLVLLLSTAIYGNQR